MGSSWKPLWRRARWAKVGMQWEPCRTMGDYVPGRATSPETEPGLVCLRNKRKPVCLEGNRWTGESLASGSDAGQGPTADCWRSPGPTGLIRGQYALTAPSTCYTRRPWWVLPPGHHHWLPPGRREGTPGGSATAALSCPLNPGLCVGIIGFTRFWLRESRESLGEQKNGAPHRHKPGVGAPLGGQILPPQEWREEGPEDTRVQPPLLTILTEIHFHLKACIC